MDKAETNLGHGQRLDKLWTKFGQTMDKDWTLRPEFVRPTILQECPSLLHMSNKNVCRVAVGIPRSTDSKDLVASRCIYVIEVQGHGIRTN